MEDITYNDDVIDAEDNFKLVELIVLYGAPFAGKTYYCEKYLPNHTRISLTEDTSLSLHRAAKVVTSLLLTGKNVVIDDINAQPQTRKAFIGPIKSCVPGCAVRAVHIVPSGGQLQCKWVATWAIAECALLNKPINRSVVEIDQWDMLNKTAPSQTEGFSSVIEVPLPIYSFFDHFDTPGLLLDCKAIISFKTINDTVTASMHGQAGTVLREWARVHPTCHIIVLIDESSLFPTTLELSGNTSVLMEGLTHCRTILHDLFLGLCLKCPLYFTCSGYDMDPQSFHKPPNLGLLSWVMYRHKLSLSASLFIGLADKVSSPISAFPAQAGINFMKADVFFGKSGWSVSSKLRMFTQENTTDNLAFLKDMIHETGHADPVEAANIVIEAAQDDLTKACVVEEQGAAEITNFVIVYPPNQDPDPLTPLPSSPASINFPIPTPSFPSPSFQKNPISPLKCPIITKVQVQNWIPDRNSFTNGQMYCNKDMVLNFCIEKSSPITLKLVCSCRGTQPNPYNVWVDVNIDENHPVITHSFCSCPAGEYSSGKCKHVAALLLYSINQSQKTNQKQTEVLNTTQFSNNKSPIHNVSFSPKHQTTAFPQSPMPFKTPSSPSPLVGKIQNGTPSPRRGLPAWMESPYKSSESDIAASARKRKKNEDAEENKVEKPNKSKKKKENTEEEDGEKKRRKKKATASGTPKKALEFTKLDSFLDDPSDHLTLQKNYFNLEKKKSFEDEFDDFDNLRPTFQNNQNRENSSKMNTTSMPKPLLTSPPSSPSSSSFLHSSTDTLFLASLEGESTLLANKPTPTISIKGFLSKLSSTSHPPTTPNTHSNNSHTPLSDSPSTPSTTASSTFSLLTSFQSSPSKSPSGTPKKVVSVKDFLKVKRGTQQN